MNIHQDHYKLEDELPLLPPGYQVRSMLLEDAGPVVDLLNQVTEEFIGSPKFSLQGMIGEWSLPEVDLENYTRIVVSPDGDIVAYGELWDIFKPYVHKFTFFRVHHHHRGKGIEEWYLHYFESLACQRINLAPEDAKVIFMTGIFGNDHDSARILEKRGFVKERVYYTMKIQLDSPPHQPRNPDGIVIRPIDQSTQEEAYFRAAQEAFRDHYGFVEEPFEDYYLRWKHMIESDPERYDASMWLAAFDGDEIAGICFNRWHVAGVKDLGWVGMVAVRRPWRRRRIAEALLLHAFNMFYDRGFQWVGLGVDSTSLTGATRLYEKAGMKVTSETHHYQKVLREGVELGTEEIAE
jgi:mycothiol synthase